MTGVQTCALPICDTRNQVEQALEDYRIKNNYESVDLIPAEEAAEVKIGRASCRERV